MSICLKYLVELSRWRVEVGFWEVIFSLVPEEIGYSFLVYFGIGKIWPNYHSLNKRITFLFLKESLTVFQILIFCYTFFYLVPFEVIENKLTKVNAKYFNGNCAEV